MEPVRRALILQLAMRTLAETDEPLPFARVRDLVEKRLQPTDYERGIDRSSPRWITGMRFATGNAATIGWLTKDRKGWTITPAGRAALARFPVADELRAECNKSYQAIRDQRIQAFKDLSDADRGIEAALAVVGPGDWTSFDDLAEIAGTTGESVAAYLSNKGVQAPNRHRVLQADGALPEVKDRHQSLRNVDLRQRLVDEGVDFDSDGRASQEQRLKDEDLRDLLAASDPAEESTRVRRAWAVRGANVEGVNLVPRWLESGFVSLAASQLQVESTDVGAEQLRNAVRRDYRHKSASYQEERFSEFDRFLHQVTEGDLMLTARGEEIFLGEFTGSPYLVTAQDAVDQRSRLRRQVRWLNADQPLRVGELSQGLSNLLGDQSSLVDLTSAAGEVDRLAQRFRPLEVVAGPAPPALSFPVIDDAFASTTLYPKEWLSKAASLLWSKNQLILHGPPGSGKTWLARELALYLTGGEKSAVQLVQLHPSYTYEDFFQGLRPRVREDGVLAYELEDGLFKAFATNAQDNPDKPYVFIIDELNRANLAKVFGELYFLLEYREEVVRLQYAPKEVFHLPRNLFVIATMNNADRSITRVDEAMRRRFKFLEMDPRQPPVDGLLRKWLDRNGIQSDAATILEELNRRIDDPEIAVGPSYLMNPAIYGSPAGLELVWETEIMPLMIDLHYGSERSMLEERFGLKALRRATSGNSE